MGEGLPGIPAVGGRQCGQGQRGVGWQQCYQCRHHCPCQAPPHLGCCKQQKGGGQSQWGWALEGGQQGRTWVWEEGELEGEGKGEEEDGGGVMGLWQPQQQQHLPQQLEWQQQC